MSDYRATGDTPPLVARAQALAEELRFTHACSPAMGRLLRTLAASVRPGETIAEIGSGCGVGTSWLLSGRRPGVRVVTVEIDPALAETTRTLLADEPDLTVLTGDWRAILAHAPFALLFPDGGKAKELAADELIAALEPGGIAALDDLTPEDQWPVAWRGQRDRVRDCWLNDPRLHATELLLTPTTAAIVATRVG